MGFRARPPRGGPTINQLRKQIARRRKFYSRPRVRTAGTRRGMAPTQIGRSLGFPKMMKFKHRYVATHLITSTTGVAQSQSYAANGMHDPDITGTGHQPMYYDQLLALYNHWTVIGSKITYRIAVSSASATVPIRVIAWINDANFTIPSTVDAIAESKFAKMRLTGGPNPRNLIISNKWSAKKFFGGSVMANDELKGSSGNNPAEVSYYFLTVQAMDASTTVAVQVQVTIDYIAVWKELKEIESS